MANKPFQTPVKSLAGKAAVFVHGFGDYLRSQHDTGKRRCALRVTQEAGQLYVSSKGESISVPYISQLTSRMEHEGMFTKERLGKSFTLMWTDESIAPLFDLLDDPEFGTSVAAAEVTVDDLKARTQMINHLKSHQGVVIHSDAPVPKAAYKILWDRFNKGELSMGFFTVVEATELAEDYPLFNASVSDQANVNE